MYSVLISAYQKCGNHWSRFLISYYFRLKKGNDKIMTTPEMHKFTESSKFRTRNAEFFEFKEGLPKVAYSQEGHAFIYDLKHKKLFDKYVYLYRNPYDVIVSYYHYLLKSHNYTIEEVTKKYLPVYIRHVLQSKKLAHLIIDYDKAWYDISPYKTVISWLDDSFDEELFKKANQMSSFENIQKMEEKLYENNEPLRYIARKGEPYSYKKEMNKKLYNYITNECRKYGLRECIIEY